MEKIFLLFYRILCTILNKMASDFLFWKCTWCILEPKKGWKKAEITWFFRGYYWEFGSNFSITFFLPTCKGRINLSWLLYYKLQKNFGCMQYASKVQDFLSSKTTFLHIMGPHGVVLHNLFGIWWNFGTKGFRGQGIRIWDRIFSQMSGRLSTRRLKIKNSQKWMKLWD